MFNNVGGYNLSDIAAVTGANRTDYGDGMWGGNGAWWLIVLFLFCFNGNGNWGNGSRGTTTREEVAYGFDINGIERSLANIQSGLCDGFYAMNSSVMNGFHGVDNAICNLGYQTQQGFNATQVALMQGQNALSSQFAQCCCDNRAGQKDIQYQMATDTCAIQTAIGNNTRDLMDQNNQLYNNLMNFMVQSKIDAKDEKIASQQLMIQQLQLKASQEAQNNYLIQMLGQKVPEAAYVVPNPYTGCCNNNNNCGGCGNSCNCF